MDLVLISSIYKQYSSIVTPRTYNHVSILYLFSSGMLNRYLSLDKNGHRNKRSG